MLLLLELGDLTVVVPRCRPLGLDVVIRASSTSSPSSLFIVMIVGTEPRELAESLLCGMIGLILSDY